MKINALQMRYKCKDFVTLHPVTQIILHGTDNSKR